ncbi:lamina-associated polypeptide 2, isoforms alpha/zeta-like [Hyperolius riggenbachi]|uniref:lamina-associated polypeptide 2, isoforms alpha/zeta-like n=1 Tax=Hyperolius riggenbachi TaxID=752182 RepID=UPI0035A294D0
MKQESASQRDIQALRQDLKDTLKEFRASATPSKTDTPAEDSDQVAHIKVPEAVTHKKATTKTNKPIILSEEEEISDNDDVSASSVEAQEMENKPSKFKFPVAETEMLLTAIYEDLNLNKASTEPSSLHDKLYEGMENPQELNFPVHQTTKNLISSQWKNPDKKLFMSRGFKRRFPFSDEDCKMWDKSPKLDSAFSQVNKDDELAFEDLGHLKDQSDKKIEYALKRLWPAICANFRPSAATTCVARMLALWMQQLEDNINKGAPKDQIISSMTVMHKAIAYIIDAASESIRLTAKAAGISNVARRNLWIKTWHGSMASKNRVCAIPVVGDTLFGPELDEVLERTANKKKSFPKKRQFKTGKRFFRQNRQTDKPEMQNKRRNWSFNKDQKKPGPSFKTPYTQNKQ